MYVYSVATVFQLGNKSSNIEDNIHFISGHTETKCRRDGLLTVSEKVKDIFTSVSYYDICFKAISIPTISPE